MGELRGKRRFLWVGILSVLLFLVIWIGGQYVVERVLREVQKTYHITVQIEDTIPVFLGLSFRGIQVKGEGFSFLAPQLVARLSWKKGISLRVEDGEFSFGGNWPLYFPLESLPPFFLEVKRGRFGGSNLPPWDGWFEKGKDRLLFEVAGGDLSVKGAIEENRMTLSGVYRSLPFRGTFFPEGGSFEGDVGDGLQSIHVQGMLSREGDRWVVSPFCVEQDETFLFLGDLLWNDVSSSLSLSGKARFFGEELELLFQGSYILPRLEGEFEGKSTSSHLQGRFQVNLKDLSFLLELGPQSVWQGVSVSGRLEGKGEDGIVIEFRDFSVSFGEEFSLLPLRGQGTLAGKVEIGNGVLQGKLDFSSTQGKVGDWELRDVSLKINLNREETRFSGTGSLFGGCLGISGVYRAGELMAQGKAEKLRLEEVLGEEDVPLSGTFSGDVCVEGKAGCYKVILSLADGDLFWQGVDLGRITGGEIVCQGEGVEVRNLVVAHERGKLSGSVVRDTQGVRGEGMFEEYPLRFSWGDREARFLLCGNILFEWGKEQRVILNLSSPSWSFGKFQGRDLSLSGEVQGEEMVLTRLTLTWDGGYLSAQGKVIPGREILLEGELRNLLLPENAFQLGGVIEKAHLAVSGPWDGVHCVFEGEGSSLRISGEPLGRYVSLKLSGILPLSSLLEGQTSLVSVLNPKALEEGTVVVKDVNLASLGGDFFLGKTGTFDLLFSLDREKKLWHFRSDPVTLSFPPYGKFQGIVAGIYDGNCLVVEEAEFQSTQGVRLWGRGTVDVSRKMLDFQLSGECVSSFPLSEGFAVDLDGEGTFHIFGDLASPSKEGSVTVKKLRIQYHGREYLTVQGLQGNLAGDTLQFSGGEGEFLGGRLTIRGEIAPGRFVVWGDLRGEETFPGFEGMFRGWWDGTLVLTREDGQYNLKGNLAVHKASIDTRSKSPDSWDILASLPQALGDFPLSMELCITLEDTLRVRTDFLDLVLSGGMSLARRGQELLLTGRLEVLEGTYNLIVCSIPLKGYIVFTEFGNFEPQLHLEGRKSVQGYDILVCVCGPLKDYVVTFSSEPVLSQEEILSLLFLGDRDAYASLDRVNLSPLLGKVARFLLGKGLALSIPPFFDAVRFDSSDFSRITFEKRLGKNATIGYTQNLNGGSAIEVDIDFSKEWSFRFERDESGEVGWMLQFSTKF